MNAIHWKNRLRQKAVVRVANKPWKTLRATFLFGFLIGTALVAVFSYFMR